MPGLSMISLEDDDLTSCLDEASPLTETDEGEVRPLKGGANTGRFGNFGVFPVFYRVFGPVNGVNLIKTL